MEPEYYEVRAVAKHIHMSPRKVRLVVDAIRGMEVSEALAQLSFMSQAAAHPVSKLIQSAAANAEENDGWPADDLYIADIRADDGPRQKRYRFAARGRIKQILKRSTHITVVLRDREAIGGQ